MIVTYTSRAIIDIDLAVGWYERQRKGLGFEFLDCLEAAVRDILENPKFYSVKYLRYRSILVRRFPFSVFYTLEKDEIVIHAVFDNRQDPAKKP